MKRTILSSLVLVAFVFAACTGGKKSEAPSLKFETIVVEKEMTHPQAIGDTDIFEYKINFTYPDDFGNKQVLELLKQNFIENTFGINPANLPADDVINAFIGGWKAEYMTEAEEYGGMNWGMEVSDSILYLSDELLQYRIFNYEYRGGAHPAIVTSYHLLDLQTGKEYKQADIFKPEKADEIRQLIIPGIFKYWETPEDEDQKNSIMEYVWTPETNFGVTEEGVVIEYNSYELGAYAYGRPYILLPYNRILPCLKEGTPVHKLAAFYR